MGNGHIAVHHRVHLDLVGTRRMASVMQVTRKLTARTWASRRTKNRIKEHGPFFDILREDPNFRFTEGQIAGILVEAHAGGWIGWLPKEQVEIHVVEDQDA